MRTLYLVRHAKSSWADPGIHDHDRPLNERGAHDAPLMARRFVDRHEALDLLVSSTAVRALATARAFAEAMRMPAPLLEPRIYEAHHRTIQGIVEGLPDDAGHIMLFGHNPGFSLLCEQLTGAGLGELPTCAVVRIDLPVESWREVSAGIGTVIWCDFPKN